MSYEEAWLRELQLYDKSIVFYQGEPGSTVELHYKVKRGGREELGYHKEMLLPVFENLYVKQYILYDDEHVSYYFQETKGKKVTTSEKRVLDGRKNTTAGKYGRINALLRMSPASRKKMMAVFEEDEKMAERMFKIY